MRLQGRKKESIWSAVKSGDQWAGREKSKPFFSCLSKLWKAPRNEEAAAISASDSCGAQITAPVTALAASQFRFTASHLLLLLPFHQNCLSSPAAASLANFATYCFLT